MPKLIPAFCPKSGQKRVNLIVILLFVLFEIVFNGKPERS
jgi:hypothetical protein